ncbi:Cobalamin biosynthesis protein CobD [BD1-7 clade bacterium]|uniref:Cobalamin biosynthesis protein CobD n=1 Tax=BD1-7 clade bacterium TaxID=2029982 RepID=A0A5S9NT24_9GAMM|nr:Cobalamin biosynthesis protein CobD [BD1-7 clade bacterium]CAA0093720.1 Cobalamin biosynthesis protein CobD [BD1-7 clade bacterium]
MAEIFLIVFAALALDYLLGEPSRWHPLVGFGNLAGFVEKRLNPLDDTRESCATRQRGVSAWLLVVVPWVALAIVAQVFATAYHWLYPTFAMFVLYLAIGRQSLVEHARAIAEPLSASKAADSEADQMAELENARIAVGMIVSRATSDLDEEQIASAATESVLENGADAIFCVIFWFAIAGIPGVVLYRLANTLDAMWGYRSARFNQFGWCAARIDDVLNYIPARLTAASYAAAGHLSTAVHCWRTQAPQWKSPNAGPVMAAGAGAIRVQLGGIAIYHGEAQERPPLGSGESPSASSIYRAINLVDRAVIVWLLVLFLMSLAVHFLF